MNSNGNNGLGNHPVVVILGIISACIAIFAFTTGFQSIKQIFTSGEGGFVPTAQPSTEFSLSTTTCGAFVDIGDSQSENTHQLNGWGGRYLDQPASPTGDTSFRYQPNGNKAYLKLCVPQIGIAYTLTTEAQDFGCDDSFEIFVNNNFEPIYRFIGTRSNIVRTHSIPIPANEINSYDVMISFESTSSDCGAAGVYNVRLFP